MKNTFKFAFGVIGGIVIAIGIWLLGYQKPLLLVSLFLLYSVVFATLPEYPSLWKPSANNRGLASGAFGFVATLAGFAAGEVTANDFHFGLAVLVLGVAMFGVVMGTYMLAAPATVGE